MIAEYIRDSEEFLKTFIDKLDQRTGNIKDWTKDKREEYYDKLNDLIEEIEEYYYPNYEWDYNASENDENNRLNGKNIYVDKQWEDMWNVLAQRANLSGELPNLGPPASWLFFGASMLSEEDYPCIYYSSPTEVKQVYDYYKNIKMDEVGDFEPLITFYKVASELGQAVIGIMT